MAKDFATLAQNIVRHIGGDTNIHLLTHCATRLRFILKDASKANRDALNQTEGVISIVESNGQFQIVIGNNVPKVYAEIMKFAHIEAGEQSDLPKTNLLSQAIDFLSSAFSPLMGVLVAVGLIKGLMATLNVAGLLDSQSGTFTVLNAMGDGFFYFLPMGLAVTAANKLKTSPYLAIAVAASLLYPSIIAATQSGQGIEFLGIQLSMMNYIYSVIPILLAVIAQSFILRFFENIIHESVRNFFAPTLTLLILVPLTLMIIGPIGATIGHTLASIIAWLYAKSALLTGLFMGAIWQVLVIFGMHWSVAPIMINNISVVGYDMILPIVSGAAVLGQTGAAMGVFFKTKQSALKSTAASAALGGAFGITEPIIYGVTLRFKKPFIFGCVGGAIGGAIIAVGGTKSFAFGFGALLGFPTMIGEGSSLMAYSLGLLVAFGIALVLTYLFGYSDNYSTQPVEANQQSALYSQPHLISPLTGEVVQLTQVPDPAFASLAMGKGVAIIPNIGELRAPVHGVINSIFPTKHAITMISDDGLEILIHMGLDTVQLKGEGFEVLVNQDEQVQAGQLLAKFDIEAISKAGYQTITPIVIVNSDDYLDVIASQEQQIHFGEPLIQIVPK